MFNLTQLNMEHDRERGFRLGWDSAMTARSAKTAEIRPMAAWGRQFRIGFVEGRDAGRIAELGMACPILRPAAA